MVQEWKSPCFQKKELIHLDIVIKHGGFSLCLSPRFRIFWPKIVFILDKSVTHSRLYKYIFQAFINELPPQVDEQFLRKICKAIPG